MRKEKQTMDLYLVNEDSPAAFSMAKKLSEAPLGVGSIVKCTKEELEVYYNGGLVKVTQPVVPNSLGIELLEWQQGKQYILICDRHKIAPKQLQTLQSKMGSKLTILFTY